MYDLIQTLYIRNGVVFLEIILLGLLIITTLKAGLTVCGLI